MEKLSIEKIKQIESLFNQFAEVESSSVFAVSNLLDRTLKIINSADSAQNSQPGIQAIPEDDQE